MIKALRQFYKFTSIRDRIKLQRQSRLAKGVDAKTLTTKSAEDLTKIRNLGIIAHIDAGKTTTTERMLYYAGALPSPGNIDEGTTTMDYLAQERERGITIRSAAISFNWTGYQLNLIDTPGHVDFSGEVTRSLRVLDGVVTIMDGVKGVEAQTMKVWAQATKHQIPKICFVNKMDRIGSSLTQSVESMVKKLKVEPLVLQEPVGDGDEFKGVYDLLDLEEILFLGKYGEKVVKSKVQKNTEKHNHLMKLREKIISTVGSYDQQIADMYLAEEFISAARLRASIRKILNGKQNNVTPVLIGSAFKNLGVQPLLDAVVSYLPAPVDRMQLTDASDASRTRQMNKKEPFTGYVFKVMFDTEKGPLAYTRIYSGHVTKNFELYNSTKRLNEKVEQILRVRANQYVPIQELSAGDIVALSGLKETTAGDTLTLGSDDFMLQVLEVPPPVFTAPFELESSKYQRQFDEAMKKSVMEDTSLVFKFEQETNQYLVSGLGELHLEILQDRLKSDGIPVKMGNLKINFMQSVSEQITQNLQVKNEVKPAEFEQFNLKIRLVPLRDADEKIEKKNQIVFTFTKVPEFDQCWTEFLNKKTINKNPNERLNFSKEQLSKLKKTVRNPTPIEPINNEEEHNSEEEEGKLVPTQSPEQANTKQQEQESESEDAPQDKQEPYYHINTLPFETLYELVETCKTSMLYGRYRLPATGIQLQILEGRYKKSSFSKSVMNRCASQLIRRVLDSSTVLIEPVMEFNLSGNEEVIDIALKDVLKRRGRVEEQTVNSLTGFIPAQGIKGWIKELRAMGLEIEFKFSDYQQVQGTNPEKLIESNF